MAFFDIEYHQPLYFLKGGEYIRANDRIVRTIAIGADESSALEGNKGYLGDEYDDFDHELTVVTKAVPVFEEEVDTPPDTDEDYSREAIGE